MTAPVTGSDAQTVRLGVAVPLLTQPPATSLASTLDLCTRLGLSLVDLSIDTIEALLGAPVPTVPLEPPPVDGVAFGLLELEEDVLRDSYELAKQTFDAQLRAWRAAGVSIDVVSVPDLVVWSDDEVDYACRAARAGGARALATRASLTGPRRLAPFARRHGVRLSFVGGTTTGADELGRILKHDDPIAVAIDLGAWTAGGRGSPLTFLDEHAQRVSHVRLREVPGDGAAITFGSGDAPIRDVLRAMRDHGWDFPAMVVVDRTPDDDDWYADVTQALAHCKASLE